VFIVSSSILLAVQRTSIILILLSAIVYCYMSLRLQLVCHDCAELSRSFRVNKQWTFFHH